MTYPNDANTSEVLQLLVVPDRHDATHERIIPSVQLDAIKR